MASDSSESPMVLTPESTGTSGPVTDLSAPNSPNTAASAAKKTRRQTAFYPNMNSANKPQKPFSRSAAKRESVMALGSIEHLQHYFTKTGLSAKKNPLSKPHHGLVPAIGGLHIPTSPASNETEDFFQMPPSPAIPLMPPQIFSPHVKTHEVDPGSLLPGVIEDVIAVAQAWRLETYKPDTKDTSQLESVHFDVLEVLKTTTRAVRSTRNYLLSLPDDSAGTIRAQFRPKSLAPGRLTRPKSSTDLSASTSSSSTQAVREQPDPIVLIRRAALEVLTVLRQLEENYRVPLDDDAYDAGSDGGHSRDGGTASSPSNITLDLPHGLDLSYSADPDASMSFSLVQVQGRYDRVLVWEDEEDSFAVDVEEAKEKKERWDERLVLGSGWLYKQDVTLGDLLKERSVVSLYLDIVDEVLFEGKQTGSTTEERGWDRIRRKREGRAVSRAAKIRRASADSTSIERRPESVGRRVSTGVIDAMRGMNLSEEPEDMHGIAEEAEEETPDELIDDDELPDWAKRTIFGDSGLARAHALIEFFLPADLRSYLPPPTFGSYLSPHSVSSSRTAFLSALSSGQLLCIAYNACVRKSKKPWGFVSRDGVHDIIALERAASASTEKAPRAEDTEGGTEGSKKLWTFRRTDNLRLWVGALKLRYMMPIHVPSQLFPSTSAPRQVLPQNGSHSNMNTPLYSNTPLSSPSRPGFALSSLKKNDREPSILFDARIVAKKDDGWDDMLESVLLNWVDRVVDERRIFHQ